MHTSIMVKAPKHTDKMEKEKEGSGPRSHPTTDSGHREKAAEKPETFGNEWNSADAGGE